MSESPSLPPQPSMPPLTERFAAMQHFYRFHFLPDGYPWRADPEGTVFAHPIYGTYILTDYLRQYEASPTPALADAIRTVARAGSVSFSVVH